MPEHPASDSKVVMNASQLVARQHGARPQRGSVLAPNIGTPFHLLP
jgi:hypothetical protein